MHADITDEKVMPVDMVSFYVMMANRDSYPMDAETSMMMYVCTMKDEASVMMDGS